MKNLRVSVLIATYNYGEYINQAIDSILQQTYDKELIEIIVVDDGSIDNTKYIVEQFIDKCNIKYIYQDNSGKAAATRKGLGEAIGDIIFILDADDWYLKDCISDTISFYEKFDSVVQVGHLAYRYNQKTNETKPQTFNNPDINLPLSGYVTLKNRLLRGYHFGLGSTYSARSIFLKQISIPDDIDMYIDVYLFLEMVNHGDSLQTDKLLSVFRRHERSYSEGEKKIENEKKRALRYLKAARAVFVNFRTDKKDFSLYRCIELFYYQHLIQALKFKKDVSLIITKFNYFKLIVILFFVMGNKISFLKQNLKLLVNG